MRGNIFSRNYLVVLLVLCAATAASAGIRADLSGDSVVDFQTTMDMPFMDMGNAGNPGEQPRLFAGDNTYYGHAAID